MILPFSKKLRRTTKKNSSHLTGLIVGVAALVLLVTLVSTLRDLVTSVLHTYALTIVAGELTIVFKFHFSTIGKGEPLLAPRKLQLRPVFFQTLALLFMTALVVSLDGPIVFPQDVGAFSGQRNCTGV